ncbi:DUF397 domain-containing protein [Kitasatospora sp. NPDC097643]|uniref:DUF397 domain-containing protein n=1 Tax=Kitasatospora sp. NPDC097643 TaxID=3157230 RepID=UPI00332BA800
MATDLGLYDLKPVPGAERTAFCGGPCTDGCVEITVLTDNAFSVKDNKLTGRGLESPELRMTGDELDAFALGWAERRGLSL